MLSVFLSILLFELPSQADSILYSNDVLGEIEPCGCRENPLGGMSRKFNFLKSKSDEFISVDAGDLLFKSESLPLLLHRQSELQAQYVLKSLDILKHQIIVPGEKDFALGLPVFEKLIKKSKARFLAANLKRKSGKSFLLEHTTVQTKNGKRIGFFGIVGEKLSWPSQLKTQPSIPEAKRQVEILKKNSNVIVAITHQGLEADRILAKQVPEIDMIIGAHTQSFLQEPIKEGKTTIYQSSFRNQHVGIIDIDNQRHQLVELDASLDSKSDQLNSIDELVTEFKKGIASLNQEPAKPSVSSKSSVHFHTFPKCAECHLKQFDFWRKTPHARALQTLFEKGQAKNKECLACHSLAMGIDGGYEHVNSIIDSDPKMTLEEYNDFFNKFRKDETLMALSKLKKAWTPVQCENCHGPGNNHPFEGAYSKTVEKSVCLTCHNQERAPGWYEKSAPNFEKIEKKKAQIACPAGQMDENDFRN